MAEPPQTGSTMSPRTPHDPVDPAPTGHGLSRLGDARGADLAPRGGPAAPRPAGLPPALASPLGLPDLLRGARRHLGLALGLGLLLGALTAAGTWYGMPTAKYRARRMLQVSSTPPKFVFSTNDVESLNAQLEFRNYQKTQETLLTSRFVLSKALARPEIVEEHPAVLEREDPESWLGDRLMVSFSGEVLSIGLEGNNPKEIKALVNAVTEAYLSEVVNVEHNRRKLRLDRLKKIHADRKKDLESRRELLKKQAEQAGSNHQETLAYKHQLAIERHAAAERELARLKTELRQARNDLALARSRPRPAAGVDPAALAAAVEQDPQVLKYREQIDALTLQLDGQLRTVRNRNVTDPAVRALRANIAAVERSLEAHRERLAQRLAAQAQAAAPDGSDLELLARKVQILEGQEQEQVAEVAKLEEGARAFSRTTMDLESNQEETEQAAHAVAQVAAEIERLEVEIGAPPRIVSLEKAEDVQPRALGSSKRLVATGFAGAGTVGLILLGFAWWDARGRRVATVDEVARGLGLDLVGVLPALPERKRLGRRAADRAAEALWDRMMTESIDSTRTMLLHASRREQVRSVMVASALKGEGKTALSCHLATSLARAGRRTLLIDCDLRSPAANILFDLPNGPGLCEVLRREVGVAEALQATVVPGLTLLPAGRGDAAAIQSLAEGNLEAVLEFARGQFDFVVVDSAPLLPVADSLQVSLHVDAVIFSVLRDVSRLPKIYEAYTRIARLGVRMLGAVVAGARCDEYGSAYHDAYGDPGAGPAAQGGERP